MNEHTPGPWVWEEEGATSYPELRSADGTLVISGIGDHYGCASLTISPADRILIAAAPDMLAALKALIHPDNEPLVLSDAHSRKLLDDVRAAIAKAEGSATVAMTQDKGNS